MGGSQRRVSAVEHGVLENTEIGTATAYIAALGGEVEMVARFGDQELVIADQVGLIAGRPELATGVVSAEAALRQALISEKGLHRKKRDEPSDGKILRNHRNPQKTAGVKPELPSLAPRQSNFPACCRAGPRPWSCR